MSQKEKKKGPKQYDNTVFAYSAKINGLEHLQEISQIIF
jgi:hypothetical protein